MFKFRFTKLYRQLAAYLERLRGSLDFASARRRGRQRRVRPGPSQRAYLAAEVCEPRLCMSGFQVLGPEVAMQAFDAGIRAGYIAGDYHGGVYVGGLDPANDVKGAIVKGSVSGGALTFGPTMWLPSLNSNPALFETLLNDVQVDPDGSAYGLGVSYSVTGVRSGVIWTSNGGGFTGSAFSGGDPSVSSAILGGGAARDFAGSLGNRAAVNDGMTLQPLPRPTEVLTQAFDRYGDVVVGQINGAALYWTKDASGIWSYHTPELPSWSDGTFSILRVGKQMMVGTIYDPRIGDSVPAAWNLDGSLLRIFDLPGCLPSELATDLDTDVTLFNNPSDPSVPSRIWTKDWPEPKLLFGDILPAAAPGTTEVALDIHEGGSLWVLAQVTNNSSGAVTYCAGSLLTRVDPPADTTPPQFKSLTLLDPNPTNSGTVRLQATFTEPVFNVDTADFLLTGSASAGAQILSVTGSGDTYVITIGVPAGAKGKLGLTGLDDDTIVDAAGNKLGGAGVNNGTFVGVYNYDIDRDPPWVVTMDRLSPASGNMSEVSVAVTLSEDSFGVDASSFKLTTTGSLVATITSVTGSGKSYVVKATITSGDGDVTFKLVDKNLIHDAVFNLLGGPALGDGDFTGPTYHVDLTHPTTQIGVNGGAQQRSMVTYLVLDFDSKVVIKPGAFDLVRAQGNIHVGLVQTVSEINGRTRVTLTFIGPAVFGGSLIDGSYQFKILAGSVTDLAGNTLVGTTTASFFRVFGDLNGNGWIDTSDKRAFDQAYGSHRGQSKYVEALDFNHDGVIGCLDRQQEQVRYVVSQWVHGPIYVYAGLDYWHPWIAYWHFRRWHR